MTKGNCLLCLHTHLHLSFWRRGKHLYSASIYSLQSILDYIKEKMPSSCSGSQQKNKTKEKKNTNKTIKSKVRQKSIQQCLYFKKDKEIKYLFKLSCLRVLRVFRKHTGVCIFASI